MAISFSLKAAGLVVVLFLLVALGRYGLTFESDPSLREVLATLLGAAATIFAGWLAWESATMQVQRAQKERVERALVCKEDAVVAIVQPVHAAAAWLLFLDNELSQPGDRDGKSLRVKRSARHLDQVLDRDLLLALMGELGADDRINLLMIMAMMRTALAMAEIHSDDVLSTDDLGRIRDVVARLEPHLGRFDSDLHKAFLKDSRMPIEQKG